MLVSTRRNDSFPKWGRQFPQVGTTVSPSGNDGFPKRERRFPQVGTAVTTSRIQKNTYFSPRLAFCRAFLLPLPAVLVSPLPILLEKSDENGNQVQILNRPAAVSFLKSLDITHATVLHEREGRPEIKQVRRPAKIRGFKGFRGKSRERRYSKYTYIPFLIISHLKPR